MRSSLIITAKSKKLTADDAGKAGMTAVLKAAYTNVGEKTPKGAWKITQLAELPGLIKKINAGTSH